MKRPEFVSLLAAGGGAGVRHNGTPSRTGDRLGRHGRDAVDGDLPRCARRHAPTRCAYRCSG